MDLTSQSKLLFGEGWVMHSRPLSVEQKPSLLVRFLGNRFSLANSFRYPIFNILVPVNEESEIEILEKRLLFSVQTSDYLDGCHGSLKERIQFFLKSELNYYCDQVWLQTIPRVFGYVFNPVSFWYCYKNKKLDAVLCEVNNTFDDRHFYFIRVEDQNSGKSCNTVKRFHVSPFLDIKGHYKFEFRFQNQRNEVKIRLYEGDKLKLDTNIKLELKPFEQVSSFAVIKKYGWMTVMIVIRIHFQALKLWLKGAKFFKRPEPPKEKLTYDIGKS